MLLKYSGIYLLARGLPGLIQLASLTLFTRLLLPEQYGHYALVLTGAGLANSVLFNWIRVGLLRFRPLYAENDAVFLSTILRCFVALCLCSGACAAVAMLFVDDDYLRLLIAAGIVFMWASGFFEIHLQLLRSQLSPVQYGMVSVVKSVITLVIGISLVYIGMAALGVLLGSILGTILSLLWLSRKDWGGAVRGRFDAEILRTLLRYGAPLTATFALNFIVSSSDRFVIEYFLTTKETGLYSVAYNLGQHTIGMLLMTVNLAGYPIIIKALEKEGAAAAEARLENNFVFLLAIGLPSAAGLAFLAGNISEVLLGADFRGAAELIMPWIAFSALLAGLKGFYFDLSFQLGRNTIGQIWVAFAAAAVNTILNFLLIPSLGLMGGAYSTLVSYILSILLSWQLGKKCFRIPIPYLEAGKICFCVVVMLLSLLPLRSYQGPIPLAGQILGGAFSYFIACCLLNVGGMRDNLLSLLRPASPSSEG